MNRLLPLIVLLALAGCSQPMPNLCVGGIIEPDGGCIAKCDPSKCVANNTCVNNVCALKCDSHFDCMADTQRCLPAVEDDTAADIFVCTDTDLKGNGIPCPQGNECPTGTSCHTLGLGDTTAYCATGCANDADCPGGFECGTVRDPHQVCGTMTGNNDFCGKTMDMCQTTSDIAANPWLTIGASCIERRVCFKRTTCSTCTSDSDCSLSCAAPNPMTGHCDPASAQKCVQAGIDHRCLTPCTLLPDGGANDKDCEQGFHCSDGFCRPIYTDCRPTTPSFCSPCRYDSDCEGVPGDLECMQMHGTERSCIDPTISKKCTTDMDCPRAPSGLYGHCLNENDGLSPGDSAYHRCYAPILGGATLTCYPLH